MSESDRIKAKGAVALRIVGWEDYYEVTDKGNKWQAAVKKARETEKEAPKKRAGVLDYVRFRVYGLQHSEDYRRLLQESAASVERIYGGGNYTAEQLMEKGQDNACRAFGLWGKLLEIAGGKKSRHRGWILSGKAEVMGPVMLAWKLGFSERGVAEDLDVLIVVGWIEAANCPVAAAGEALIRFGAENEVNPDFSGDSRKILEFQEPYINETKPNTAQAKTTESEIARRRLALQKYEEEERSGGGPRAPEVVGEGGRLDEGGGEKRGKEGLDGDSGGKDSESDGSPGPVPAESGAGGSGARGSDKSGGSGTPAGPAGAGEVGGIGDSENRDSGNRTGDRAGRGGTAPLKIRKAINGLVILEDGQSVSWEIYLRSVDLEREDPRLVLNNLTVQGERARREEVIMRALGWAKGLAPGLLDEDEALEGDGAEKARINLAGMDHALGDLWEARQEEGIIFALQALQEVVADAAHKKGTRRAIRNVMAVVMKKINVFLGRADKKQGQAPGRHPP